MSVTTYTEKKIDNDLTIDPFIPSEAHLGWKVELLRLSRPIPSHYHKVRRQFILAAEGKIAVSVENKEAITLTGGELIMIDPGSRHSIHPLDKAGFFGIDFPGFAFPEDVFYDTPQEIYEWDRPYSKHLKELDSNYFGMRRDLGEYSSYELAGREISENKWSLALLEIQNSPKHVHQAGKEVFIVTEGVLDLHVEGEHKLLKAGDAITIFPKQVHQLKSALDSPVRVLCFNFPAFTPEDMHVV